MCFVRVCVCMYMYKLPISLRAFIDETVERKNDGKKRAARFGTYFYV